MNSVTVVGNGVAGFACAKRLAELGADVTMIGPGLPYDRPPLSKRALEGGRAPLLADADALIQLGIRHLDGLVTAFDAARRDLVVQPTGGGSSLTLPADRIVWATGLLPNTPPIPGLGGAECNSTASGMERLAARLAAGRMRVAVIGAGLIGSETAATLARRHQVTMLDVAERPLARFTSAISEASAAALDDAGVSFVGGCRVVSVSADGVLTETHGHLAAGVVISAAGVRSSLPASLAEGSALLTDETLRVIGHDALWACGDVARFPHPRFGTITIPHWDHARASGRHAAESALGSGAEYVRDPYWFSDLGRLRVQQVGFSEAAVEWRTRDGIHVGHDCAGRAACAVLFDAPHRLREARALVAA
jgi:3-phenylpropionate/trans-cinnamate dioxygenase ferredoxin reductase subunit